VGVGVGVSVGVGVGVGAGVSVLAMRGHEHMDGPYELLVRSSRCQVNVLILHVPCPAEHHAPGAADAHAHAPWLWHRRQGHQGGWVGEQVCEPGIGGCGVICCGR